MSGQFKKKAKTIEVICVQSMLGGSAPVVQNTYSLNNQNPHFFLSFLFVVVVVLDERFDPDQK